MAKKLREIVVAVTADTAAYQREMNRVSRMGGDYFKTIEQGAKRADTAYQRNTAAIRLQVTAVDEATQAVANYARAAAAVFSTGKAVQYADSWTNLNNRLRLVTDSTQEFQAAQDAVFNIAVDARAPLQSTAELYQRIAANQDALSLSGAGVASIVDTISKTLAISGTTAASADAALMQLGQAFASGTLRGEELNSVMEQAPALAAAIAAGLGVPRGELKAMGEAGELTAQKVVGALQKMAGSVDAQFAKMQVTVGQSFTVLETKVTKWIGQADEATGASKALASGVIALSDNLDKIAAVGAVAGMRLLGGKLVEAGAQAFQATQAFKANRAELVEGAKAQLAAAQMAARRAAAESRSAHVTLAAAKGEEAKAAAIAGVVRARATEVASINAVAVAQTRLNSISGMASAAARGLLGVLGGPAGLAITVASVAAGWLMFRDKTDDAARAVSKMKGPLDEVIAKYRELNAQQRDQALRSTRTQIDQARSDARAAFDSLVGTAIEATPTFSRRSLDGFLQAIKEIRDNSGLGADEASRQLQVQIEGFAKATPISQKYRDEIVDLAAAYISGSKSAEELTARLRTMEGAQQDAAGGAAALGAGLGSIGAGMGAADWAKYLKNLESTRDLIGLTAKEAEEYKARAQGASDAQAALAGTLAQQADAAELLKKATADKDAKAIQGAKETLDQLVKVEAQQRAIIAAAAEAGRLQSQLAKGGITPEGFNQMVGEVYAKVYDQALEAGTTRNAGQIAGIGANTTPSRSSQKSGDDWAKWVKDRQAEVTAQLQLAEAYRLGGDAVAKATLAKEVEDQVLKVGAGHRAEIVRLLGQEADARARADASKQIAEMGKEIALIDAKTEAERVLWETQSGSYAALDENIKKALVGRAEELDLARKASSRTAYIGQVSGRTEADETLEKMGWLSDAFQKNELSLEQYNRALGELTGRGLGDLTEFAVQGARNIQTYLGDSLYQVVTGKFEGIGSAFVDMLARMASEAAAANLAGWLFGDFGKSGSIGGVVGSIGSQIGGWMTPSAKGNAFDAGALTPFAKGGAFTNKVVDSPVAFPMGLMGEAGPEAIMPLSRGPDGRLGVRAEIGSSNRGGGEGSGAAPAPDVSIVINVQDGGASTTTQGGQSDFWNRIAQMIRRLLQEEMMKSHRQGGITWNSMQGVG